MFRVLVTCVVGGMDADKQGVLVERADCSRPALLNNIINISRAITSFASSYLEQASQLAGAASLNLYSS